MHNRFGPFTNDEIHAIYQKFMGTTPIHPNKSPWTGEKQIALVAKLKDMVDKPLKKDERSVQQRSEDLRNWLDEHSPGWRESFKLLAQWDAEDTANDPGLQNIVTVERLCNNYVCPNCNEGWTDVWCCACNDECPYCHTKDVSPETSETLESFQLQLKTETCPVCGSTHDQ